MRSCHRSILVTSPRRKNLETFNKNKTKLPINKKRRRKIPEPELIKSHTHNLKKITIFNTLFLALNYFLTRLQYTDVTTLKS